MPPRSVVRVGARRVGRVLVALVGVALLWVGATPDGHAQEAPASGAASEAQRAYEEARAAYQRCDMDAAIEHLRAAIKLQPDPVYVYNLARAEETAGRLGDAYTTFLRARAMPTITEDLRELATAGVERLASVRTVAVLDLSGFVEGSLIQLDGDLVADPSAAQRLQPGDHQVCALSPARDRMSCFQRSLAAGVRVAFPPAGGLRSAMSWPSTVAATSLTLGGYRLLLPVAEVREVELDSGRTAVHLRVASGPGFRGDVELLPGGRQVLKMDDAAGGESQASSGGGAGVGPWILGGVGVAVLGTGAALWGVSAGVAGAPSTETIGGLEVSRGKSQKQRQADWEEAQMQQLAGVVLVGLGAAALVGGVVWVIVGSGGDEDTAGSSARVSAAPWLTPEVAGAAVMGRF